MPWTFESLNYSQGPTVVPIHTENLRLFRSQLCALETPVLVITLCSTRGGVQRHIIVLTLISNGAGTTM